MDVSPALLPKFPLLIDTGHNHNVSMQVSQLRTWAGLQTSKLLRLGDVLINGRRAALYELTLWIHPNRPGKSELDFHRQPCRVDLYDGVSILPDRGYPRIPLLGLRVISSAGLRLEVNGASQTMSMNVVSGALS